MCISMPMCPLSSASYSFTSDCHGNSGVSTSALSIGYHFLQASRSHPRVCLFSQGPGHGVTSVILRKCSQIGSCSASLLQTPGSSTCCLRNQLCLPKKLWPVWQWTTLDLLCLLTPLFLHSYLPGTQPLSGDLACELCLRLCFLGKVGSGRDSNDLICSEKRRIFAPGPWTGECPVSPSSLEMKRENPTFLERYKRLGRVTWRLNRHLTGSKYSPSLKWHSIVSLKTA